MSSLPEGGCQLHLALSPSWVGFTPITSWPGLQCSPSPPVARVAESQGQPASGGAVGIWELSRETALQSCCLLPTFAFPANPRLLLSHHPNQSAQHSWVSSRMPHSPPKPTQATQASVLINSYQTLSDLSPKSTHSL